MTCPLCHRANIPLSNHHLIPKTRGGMHKGTIAICVDCHVALHAQFSNKQLEKEYNSVEALLSNERFAKTIKFISKQNPARRIKTKLPKNQRRRGRNG